MSQRDTSRPPIIIKKKKGGGHGHHGGVWKVAYADFITAMMALFLLLWLVGQKDQKLKESVANYFRNPGIFNRTKGGILPGSTGLTKDNNMPNPPKLTPTADDEMVMLQKMASQMKDTFNKIERFENIRNQIRITITKEGLEIQLVEKANRVLFDIGSAHPKDYTREVLVEIAKEIGQIPNRVVISGHTDHRPYSNEAGFSNWELSADRANSARRVLTENGLNPEQVARIVGYADTVPIDPKDPYADANRRISILVLPRAVAAANGTPLEDSLRNSDKNSSEHKDKN